MPPQANILIINNNENEINQLNTILGGIYNLEIIGTTTEAISLINADPNIYSIIIVALNMPVLNGYLFCLTIKKDMNVRDIPIIITGSLVEFNSQDPVSGLRIGEYDTINTPFRNKTVLDLVELNVEKKKMFERLKAKGITAEETTLHTPIYFREVLDLEILRAARLNTTLSCLSIKPNQPEVRENLLSLIKNTCRYYDVGCSYDDRVLLLLPCTTFREGEMIVSRFNTIIYGLSIELFFFDPTKMDALEFKREIFRENIQRLEM